MYPPPPRFLTIRTLLRMGSGWCPTNIHINLVEEESSLCEVHETPTDVKISALMPRSVDHHTALGEFLDYWSRLEHVLIGLLGKLSDVKPRDLRIFTNAMTTKTLCDALSALATRKLDPAGPFGEFANLIERVLKLNAKRNHLVHGHWVLEVLVQFKKGLYLVTTNPVREHTPSDPRIDVQLGELRNQKLRVKYLFNLTRIRAASNDADKLREDLENFSRQRSAQDPNTKPGDDAPTWEILHAKFGD